jgi:hypothetical protein
MAEGHSLNDLEEPRFMSHLKFYWMIGSMS